MSHSLVEIPQRDWAKLCNLYNEHRKEPSDYGLLHIIIQWLEKDSALDIKIYAPDGNWKNDGTFLLILKVLNRQYISFNTLNNNLEGISAALNCLDTNLEYWFFGISERLRPAVEEHFKYVDIDNERIKFDNCVWYHIQKEKALQFEADAPKDYKLLPLEVQHAEQMNSIWLYRAPGTVEYVKLLIRLNDSVGLFDKSGNLIAWCLRFQIGSFGLLQVVDNHKRKGFGSLVVRSMAKTLASKNEEVTAAVLTTNTASRGMFEKLGFSVIENVFWALKPSK